MDGAVLPPGHSLYVDGDEVVIAWPAYQETGVIPFANGNGNFELGDIGWAKGAGWAIEPSGGDNVHLRSLSYAWLHPYGGGRLRNGASLVRPQRDMVRWRKPGRRYGCRVYGRFRCGGSCDQRERGSISNASYGLWRSDRSTACRVHAVALTLQESRIELSMAAQHGALGARVEALEAGRTP